MRRLYIRHVERMERDRRGQLLDHALDALIACALAVIVGVAIAKFFTP